jgi:Holliday junction resolvase RusA-like endonuclease
VSFGMNNTRADVDSLVKALTDIMPMQNSAVMLAANL